MSTRKEQAIYGAVHETVMRLRIALYKELTTATYDHIDTQIAQAGHAAGMAAIAAYRAPVKPQRRPTHDR